MAITNAQKQERWRRRHATEIRAKRERAALTSDPRVSGPRPSWYVADLLDASDPDGVPLDTVIYQKPDGRLLSHRWTPRVPMTKEMATRVMRARRGQVRTWAGL
jgi:hypothetical protein